jgi:hypothetical protein
MDLTTLGFPAVGRRGLGDTVVIIQRCTNHLLLRDVDSIITSLSGSVRKHFHSSPQARLAPYPKLPLPCVSPNQSSLRISSSREAVRSNMPAFSPR